MNSTASAVLTSAEKIAASRMAPSPAGRSLASSVGSASSCGRPACRTRAARPSTAGTQAKTNSAAAFQPMPRRTACSLLAPNAFCSRPGDETNAGTSRTRNDADVAPFQMSLKPWCGADPTIEERPPP